MRNDFDASTVVCLTLAKWETVFGQFGGYLSTAGTAIGTLERSSRGGGQRQNNWNQPIFGAAERRKIANVVRMYLRQILDGPV